MTRISIATVDATPVVTVRARRWLVSAPAMLAVGLGSFGVVVGVSAVRTGSLLGVLVALPLLALAAWLARRALWKLIGSVRIVVEPERIVIERCFAGRTVVQQTATRAEVARLEIVRPPADNEQDDTDDRSFVRIATDGGAVIDVGRDLDLSDADARVLAAAMMLER